MKLYFHTWNLSPLFNPISNQELVINFNSEQKQRFK